MLNFRLEYRFFHWITCIKSIHEAFNPITLDESFILLHFTADLTLHMWGVATVTEIYVSSSFKNRFKKNCAVEAANRFSLSRNSPSKDSLNCNLERRNARMLLTPNAGILQKKEIYILIANPEHKITKILNTWKILNARLI